MEKQEIKIRLPVGLGLSEEEKAKIAKAVRNEIVDIVKVKQPTMEVETIYDHKA